MVRNYKRKTEDRWSKEDLLEALLSIHQGHLKVNDAAKHYGISRATLYRQYMKFIDGGASCDVNQFRTCGGNPILTKMEEDVLETTIKGLREQGFTVEAGDIKRICFEYCDTNGIDNQFNVDKRMASDDWYYGFLKRHPGVKLSRPYKKRSASEEASSSGPGTSASASVTSATDKAGEALKDGVIKTAPTKVSRPQDKPKQPAAIILTVSPVKKRKRSAAGGTQPGTDSKRAKKGPADEVKTEIDAEDLKTEDDQIAEGNDKAKEDEQAGVEGLEGQGGRDDQSVSDESDEGEETEENSGTSDSEDEESGGDSDSE